MADALDLGSSAYGVGVRLPLPAPKNPKVFHQKGFGIIVSSLIVSIETMRLLFYLKAQ